MKNLLVLGYFGFLTNQLDGQTVKTRNLYNLFKKHDKEISLKITFFDTQCFQKSKFYLVTMILRIFFSRKIYYLGAHGSLKYLSPAIIFICWLFRKEFHYVVIGGWLYEFLLKNPFHSRILKHVKAIYPETSSLCEKLRCEFGYKNVYQLRNFRCDPGITPAAKDSDLIHLVFMARVHPMKGIDVLFKLCERLESKGVNNVVIDVFGPIIPGYHASFNDGLQRCRTIMNYKGVIPPDDITSVLSNYDVMLFPTRFYTEGLPGSIIDAYMAGVPVVVSNWKYAEELVIREISGVICEFGNDESFIDAVCRLINDPSRICYLKSGARAERVKYSSDTAWSVLKNVFN